MKKITFITGNQGKADFMAKFLDFKIPHQKLNLDEIQSLDLHEITEHKARQAYQKIKSPVLVEDVSFVYEALGKLPGPFIKWFLEPLGEAGVCDLVSRFENRRATGYGWDFIFIPDGTTKTYGEMNDEEKERFSLRTTTVYPQIKQFLERID